MVTGFAPVLRWLNEGASGVISLGAVPENMPRVHFAPAAPDPVTFAVLGGALFSVCQEMDITLRNSSLSPIINVGKDFSCAIFTADAQLVAQACNCPGHIGSMHYAVRSCIEAIGVSDIADGDVYMLNDPYQGGTHLPDITLISPVFYKDELVMFAGNRAHHSDVGGSCPGSFPLSKDIFQEGIRIPPLKYFDQGREVPAVMPMLLANVRTPEEVQGDIDAQVAANSAGVRALAKLMDKYGLPLVLGAISDYMDASERAFRASLNIPEGTYSAEDWMDGDGATPGPRKIRATITVSGTDVLVDFTGTDPQARGPINSVFPTTASMAVAALLSLTDPTIMPNHGFYRPIHIKAPVGTMVNPVFPAAAVGFPDVCNRIVDVIMEALTPVMPERVIASTSGTTTNCFFGGMHPANARPYVWYNINSQGGWGGRGDGDGWHDVCFIEANGWDIPVETIEYRYPWRVLAYKLREDDSGAGKFRGGKGSYLALTPLGHDVEFAINGDRAVTAPYGLFGGKPGSTGRCTVYRSDGSTERIAPEMMKADGVVIRSGEVIIIEAPSGGGYGNPLERKVELVAKDVRDAIVSRESARLDYGVVFDDTGSHVDATATSELRERMRRAFQKREREFSGINRHSY
ncbi:MAG: hydantoinase B/oxoprolinase family protein, partial [Acidobacteria bacterium]|nr:hydantoinase B/oxoprolinase family protein [Acidobacteriota bacterium]